MSNSAGSILLDLQIDTSGLNRSINECARNAGSRMAGAFQGTSSSVQQSIQRINAAIESSTNKLNRQETAIAAQRNIIAGLNATLEQAKNKYREQTEAISRQENVVRDLESEYERLAGRVGPPTAEGAREMERLSRQLEAARNRLNSLNQSAETCRNRMNNASGSVDTANRRLQNMQAEAEQTRRHIEELNQELANIQSSPIEGGMQRITSAVKKAGSVIAAAFALYKLVDFGKECIKLGSDLQEVQNVIDVTFTTMSSQLNSFAQSAAASFGLSETMAKKFAGTFGAMSKSFGFSEQAAYEMSTALTGLSGDVASFYNISQDEAYTKLKSVFTGETETLKDLGVVMTQAALDQYALANGYGKTTAKMSEAEKVALRYKFVTEQLTLASGDFLRTSDGWANQVRVLKLQFDSLKAAIGQGLINVLTPVIKVINVLVGKLMTLANAFKTFTEFVTGKKNNGADAMKSTAAAADEAAESTAGVGSAAKKAAKEIKGAVAGFDELNILSSSSGGGGSGGSGTGGGYGADSFAADPESEGNTDALDGKFDSLLKKAKELSELFRQGFTQGLGDVSVFNSIQNSVESIGTSLKNIFTAPEVLEAANKYSNTVALSLGTMAGSALSIGASVADNLLGGLSNYLNENSERIKDYLVGMFDIGARVSEISANFAEALATVFESLRSDGAKSITESIIGIFADGFMGVTLLAGSFATDLLDLITAPFTENADKIKTSLEGAFSAVAPVFEDTKELVDEMFSKLQGTYDEKVKPVITNIKEGLTDTFEKAFDAYDTHVVPALEEMSQKFGEFKEQYLSPLIDKFTEFQGKVAEAIQAIWDNCLKPFADWFVTNLYPAIAYAIGVVSDVFFALGAGISDIIGGIWDALSGLMDFITGVFSGDWEKAWTGIKEFFGGIWDALVGVVTGVLGAIWSVIQNVFNTIASFFKKIWDGIKQKFVESLNSILDKIDSVFPGMKAIIIKACTAIKNKISEIWNGIKKFLSETMEKIFSGIQSKLNKIKSIWSSIWGSMKKTVTSIFGGIWSVIKKVINSILGGIETMVNGIVRGLNRAIEALNRITFEVPDWVPAIGGMSFGFNVPQLSEIAIPKLAQGGYVRANTPQLAMIGDNRHQGEIVAPEDKIYEVSRRAMQDAIKGLSQDRSEPDGIVASLLRELISAVEAKETGISEQQIHSAVRKQESIYRKRNGRSSLIY